MTAKRFTYDSKTVSILKDGEFWLDGNVDTACNHSEICNELNKLTEENKQLKQQIKELYKMVKYDVDNEIEVYPKTLAKYLVNILKIIGDVE